MKTLAIIPARGGSKRLPGKNIRMLCGKPLIAWTIEAALKSGVLDRVVVSTDDEEIRLVSETFGAEVPVMRPSNLATDDAPTLPVLQHIVNFFEEGEGWTPTAIVMLQPTSPLRTAEQIQEAVIRFLNDSSADSLASCMRVPKRYHPYKVMLSQDTGYLRPLSEIVELMPPSLASSHMLVRNGGAIYISSRETIRTSILGGNILAYEMDEESSLDIDDISDFVLAETLLKNYTEIS